MPASAPNGAPQSTTQTTTQTTTGGGKQSALDSEFSAPCVSYDSNRMGPDGRDRRGAFQISYFHTNTAADPATLLRHRL